MSGPLSRCLSVWVALEQVREHQYSHTSAGMGFVTTGGKFSAWGQVSVSLLFIRRKSSEFS